MVDQATQNRNLRTPYRSGACHKWHHTSNPSKPHADRQHFARSFGWNYRCQNFPRPPGKPFNPSPIGSPEARPVRQKEGDAVDPKTNIGKPYANRQHFAKIFGWHGLSKPWTDRQHFTGSFGWNYLCQNSVDPTTNIGTPLTPRHSEAQKHALLNEKKEMLWTPQQTLVNLTSISDILPKFSPARPQ